MSNEPILDVRDLSKVYPDGTKAVQGVTFQVGRGEFFGFLGPNGAGKSTTIKMLITLLAKTSGESRTFSVSMSVASPTPSVVASATPLRTSDSTTN